MTEAIKAEMVRAYEDWLSLLDYLSARFAAEWPKGDLRPHMVYDEIIVLGRRGKVGRIYRDKDQYVLSSSPRKELRQIDSDEDRYMFHEESFDFVGWQTNERMQSDIKYSMKYFWQTAVEEAEIVWNATVLANDVFDK